MCPKPPPTHWRNVTCQDGVLPVALEDGAKQWADSKAEDAWKDAVAEWDQDTTRNANFSTWLADYFDAPIAFACHKVGGGECSTSLNCASGANAPAGYVILESMRMLFNRLDNYYWGLYNAHQMMDAEVDAFTLLFSPQIDPLKDEKILLDILGLVFACINVSAFNVFFKKIIAINPKTGLPKPGHPNSMAQGKDLIAALATASINMGKDSKSAIDVFAKVAEMHQYLKDLVWEMIKNWEKQVEQIFTDPEQLHQFITNGLFWTPGQVISPEDVIPTLEHTLYAYLIPHAWATSNAVGGPIFIATSDGVPMRKGQTGCKAYDPKLMNYKQFGYWADAFIFVGNEPKVLGQSSVCDGEDAYWLVGVEKEEDPDLPVGTIKNPPGWDKFSDDKWGGISREEIALNAIDSWKFNGKINGEFYPEMNDIMTLDMPRKLPRGFINIPVCSWIEAARNIKVWDDRKSPYDDNPHFPCNK
ncbi:hypothetical protein BDV95DRAFT_603077 [Massariosphaeria phaeospora]|uniref:Uncharacterized protein n=1 Tax=Massariosphaeria phaeospora TaxID=100035 RepID=A0A7C8IBV6_9PLEO|nr:hypothetical protein BDV95DRAFT_603077 [Massariosphaeria phaeospora]